MAKGIPFVPSLQLGVDSSNSPCENRRLEKPGILCNTKVSQFIMNDFLSPAITRRRFAVGIGLFGLTGGLRTLIAADQRNTPTIMIIGDSMALCGFGKTLDRRFRSSGYPKVFTYMACGTNPLSWMSIHPYTKIRTPCGLWTIESTEDGKVREIQDTYGMTPGHKPAPHPVPKIEELLFLHPPDLLIVQLGNNLLDLPYGKKDYPGSQYESFLNPFLDHVTPKVGKVIWVAPPVSGRIPKEKQDQLVNRLKAYPAKNLTVIDSRDLLAYPYSHLQPDKQHFIGKDMDLWADKVFSLINTENISSPAPTPTQSTPPQSTPNPKPLRRDPICVMAALEQFTPPYSLEETAPYYKCLIEEVYKVRSTSEKTLRNKRIVLLRISIQNGKRTNLLSEHHGRIKKLNLIPFQESGLANWACRRDARFTELAQFALAEEDETASKLEE